MEVLSFSVEEQNSIFRILSSVLHLGNVYFEKYEVPQAEPRSSDPTQDEVEQGGGRITPPPYLPQTDCQEVATVVSATEIRTVAELLQVSPEGLQKAITFKVTVSAGSGVQAGRQVPGPRGPRLVLIKPSCCWFFPNQETLREKIFTPLTVESAVDAR